MENRTSIVKYFIKHNSISENFFLLGSLLFFGGLLGMRALLSIGPIVMLGSAFLDSKNLMAFSFKKFLHNFWPLLFFYVLLLLNYFTTEDIPRWTDLLNRKIPLILIPLSFSFYKFKKQNVLFLFGIFTIGVAVIAALSYINYLQNKAYWDAMISHSKNIPVIVKIFHIHFGIMMAFATVFAFYIYKEIDGKLKWVFLFLSTLIFILLHLLAYRTGLLGIYFLLGFYLVRMVILERRYVLATLFVIIFTLSITGFYFQSKTVQLKVENTLRDVNRFYSGGDINFYSISQRLAAWTNAIEIFKQHKLLGVGMADMEMAMEKQYKIQDFGLFPSNRVLIHNQYLHTLVTTGIIGFLFFLIMLFRPIFRNNYLKNNIGLKFLLMCFGTMLVDSYLELQVGLNLFLFFYCLVLVDWQEDSMGEG